MTLMMSVLFCIGAFWLNKFSSALVGLGMIAVLFPSASYEKLTDLLKAVRISAELDLHRCINENATYKERMH
jgi:hypothetical protein